MSDESEDLMTHVNAVRTAAGKLEERHFNWIISHAIESIHASMTKLQDERVRINAFPATAAYTTYGKREERLDERVDEITRALDGYTKILDALYALRRLFMYTSATRWAEAISASGLLDTLLGKMPRPTGSSTRETEGRRK